MAKFEKVNRFSEIDINLPERKTANSAGYDMEVAEDIIIPSYQNISYLMKDGLSPYLLLENGNISARTVNLEEMKEITQILNTKPTLVPTGIKCQLEPNTYLELSVRSSCSLKYWLILANGVGRL